MIRRTNTTIRVVGLGPALRDIDRLSNEAGRSVKKTMLEVARSVCQKLMHVTQPYGLSAAVRKVGEFAVAWDIKRVIIGAYQGTIDMVKDAGPNGEVTLEDGTVVEWAKMTENPSDLRRIHESERKGGRTRGARGGKFRKGQIWRETRRVVVPQNDLDLYIKERQEQVGLAKSVWYNSSLKLRGISQMRAPAWIRRHKGTGTADVRATIMGVYIYLRDQVGYLVSPKVLSPDAINRAIVRAVAGKLQQIKKEIEAKGR